MAGDDLQLCGRLAQHGGGPLGDILVARAVETVPPHLVVLVVLVGQGIGKCLGGHGLMEGGVEHGNHRHVGHDLLAGTNAGDVGGIVERGQRDARLNRGHHLVVDADGLVEGLATMHHAVTHRVDLLHGANDTVFGVHQSVQNSLNGFGMGGHGHIHGLQRLFSLNLGLVGELAVDANALAQALGQHDAGIRVHQLILQGRTSGVDDENFHGNSSFCGRSCRRPQNNVK